MSDSHAQNAYAEGMSKLMGAPRQNRPFRFHLPGKVGKILESARAYRRGEYEGTGRNEPCPCGSGLKYKKCHGSWENRSRQ